MLGHTIRALVVDDNEDSLEIVSLYLTNKRVRVDTAGGGLEALRLFHENPLQYDVILLDIQMPDMDGFEVARHIRENAPVGAKEIPIIAMSGETYDLSDGDFTLFLPKPFQFERLLPTIESVIKQR